MTPLGWALMIGLTLLITGIVIVGWRIEAPEPGIHAAPNGWARFDFPGATGQQPVPLPGSPGLAEVSAVSGASGHVTRSPARRAGEVFRRLGIRRNGPGPAEETVISGISGEPPRRLPAGPGPLRLVMADLAEAAAVMARADALLGRAA